MEVVPSKIEVASSKIEVSPFFVDFHDSRTFVAIYILSRFTHFFRQFFLANQVTRYKLLGGGCGYLDICQYYAFSFGGHLQSIIWGDIALL